VIGDAVNLASRLENATKQVGYDLLVSREAVQACTRTHKLTRIDEIHVPGREGSVVVYGE
jgi:class 3 adenylate cyclase